jgi:hypothetical protein
MGKHRMVLSIRKGSINGRAWLIIGFKYTCPQKVQETPAAVKITCCDPS